MSDKPNIEQGQDGDQGYAEQLRAARSLLREKAEQEKRAEHNLQFLAAQLDATHKRITQQERVIDDARNLLKSFTSLRRSLTWRILERIIQLALGSWRPGSQTSLDIVYRGLDNLSEALGGDSQALLPATRSNPRSMVKQISTSPAWGDGTGFEVSIIVLNLNGDSHLERLFSTYIQYHELTHVQWIVVDHGSDDQSINVIKEYFPKLPLKLLECQENNTFAAANNLATEYATSETLVFCNNDISFDEPVLEALCDPLKDQDVGGVGIDLFFPDEFGARSDNLQHAGIEFQWDKQFSFPRPVNKPRGSSSKVREPAAAATAALFAMRKADFHAIEGFHEHYNYGYEDVDLCLTLQRSLGKRVIIRHDFGAIHNESATQNKSQREVLARRRRGNISTFILRQAQYVEDRFLESTHQPSFEQHKSKNSSYRVGLVVTETGETAVAGDFFTASELASAFESELGWKTIFLSMSPAEHDAYDATNLDCVISLLDSFELPKLRNMKPGLIKVGWLRNWFERWVSQPWINHYDLLLCSSHKSVSWVSKRVAVETVFFPIATNVSRFSKLASEWISSNDGYQYDSDYCFTGNYWGSPREIEQFQPKSVKHNFGLFGSGWGQHAQFQHYYRGSVPYGQIEKVYANTRILVDDANHVTKEWGSVNSRVFDALGAGVLVLTNSEEGSRELFEGRLPVWKNAGELGRLIDHFLTNESERVALVNSLRNVVVEGHTYVHRAETARRELLSLSAKHRIAIKIAVPSWEIAKHWGDFHFAMGLAKSLRRLGFRVRVDVMTDWYKSEARLDDTVIVLRGLTAYTPNPSQVNFMWNISHPKKVSRSEYEAYDHVFIASEGYAARLGEVLTVPVQSLLQCTDPDLFYFDESAEKCKTALFVGNSRKVERPIVKQAIKAGCNLQIFGEMWGHFVDPSYIQGSHIPNADLAQHYATAGVVLNDHWEDMRSEGFISNRLFDAVATGATVVSDPVEGIKEIFGEAVLCCNPEYSDFVNQLETALNRNSEGTYNARGIAEFISKEHSFNSRARVVSDLINSHDKQPMPRD